MASLASRFTFAAQLSISRRLLHTSRAALAIPQGKEREEYIDQGSTKVLQAIAEQVEASKTELKSITQRFNTLHEIYYGKDRDLVNYPPNPINESTPKVRLGFLPDSWFQAFYDKTGVLGPYILALGVPTLFVSKEWFIIDPEGMVLLTMTPFVIWFVKKYGQRIKEIQMKWANENNETTVAAPLRQARDSGQQVAIKAEEQIQGQKVTFEEAFKAKREILDLQLEEEYRRRLADVARSVERRMTYHVELAAAKKNFQQQHLVQWVLDGVTKGITPQQEKETIQQCIKDLKSLAARA